MALEKEKMSSTVISIKELSEILRENTPLYASIILNNLSHNQNQSKYTISEVIKVVKDELNSSLLWNECQRTINALQRISQKSVHWTRAPTSFSPQVSLTVSENKEKGVPDLIQPSKDIQIADINRKVIIMDQSTFDRLATINGVKF